MQPHADQLAAAAADAAKVVEDAAARISDEVKAAKAPPRRPAAGKPPS